VKNPVGAELQAAQLNLVKSNEKLVGEEALRLIDAATTASAGSRFATPPAGNMPPPAPVQVLPREGSTIEVVA
jgi:hypothetical protein